MNPMQYLVLGHIIIITLSNVLVMYPVTLMGLYTTWGAFSYSLIFILTDLSTRLMGSRRARQVIFVSMFPGLMISYLLASLFDQGQFQGFASLSSLHVLPLRIATACFFAYIIGQLLDIIVFERYRKNASWWLAPAVSTTVGNIIDTYIFFSIAFYQCNNPFLSTHWLEIATVDMGVKIGFTLLAFVPLYGIILRTIQRKFILSSS